MNKRIRTMMTGLLSAILLVVSCMANVYAGESVITLEKDASTFSKVEQDLDFANMEPGEQRTAVISLENHSDHLVDFYLNGEIVYNIADAAQVNKSAVYELTLTRGEELAPYFTGRFGSEENTKVDTKQMLQKLAENVKVASLGENDQEKVMMTLTLDGASTGNEYMNQEGKIRLNIGTEPRTEIPAAGKVATGDRTPILFMLLLGAGAIAVFGAVWYLGRKQKNNKKEQ